MNQIVRLSVRDWLLILQALPILIGSRLLVILLPFRKIARILGCIDFITPVDSDEPLERETMQRIGWTLRALSRYLPWRSLCLEQALAAMLLLRFKGLSSTLYFGVYSADDSIKAHAWLRCGSTIVTGAKGREPFTVVFTVASKPSKSTVLMPFNRTPAAAEPQADNCAASRPTQ